MSPLALGVGSGCVTLPRDEVERAPRRSPAGHPEHTDDTAAGRDSADGIIRSIARTSAVRT